MKIQIKCPWCDTEDIRYEGNLSRRFVKHHLRTQVYRHFLNEHDYVPEESFVKKMIKDDKNA